MISIANGTTGGTSLYTNIRWVLPESIGKLIYSLIDTILNTFVNTITGTAYIRIPDGFPSYRQNILYIPLSIRFTIRLSIRLQVRHIYEYLMGFPRIDRISYVCLCQYDSQYVYQYDYRYGIYTNT
jgi:hypothetical protein